MELRRPLVGMLLLVACGQKKAQPTSVVATGDAQSAVVSLVPDASSDVQLPFDASVPVGEVGTAGENDSRSSIRKAILDGLRTEVQRQYAGSKVLASAELVFVVKTLRSDEKFAYVYAETFRKTATGNTKIVQRDLDGTKFAKLSQEGVFDGPTVIAVLSKGKDGWRVARFPKGEEKGQLAIAMGPTDFPGEYYLETFGLPKAWVR